MSKIKILVGVYPRTPLKGEEERREERKEEKENGGREGEGLRHGCWGIDALVQLHHR